MDPERWQQINQLFHSALERAAGERAPFLAQACNGDESLRLEVESLIGSHEQSSSFIEAPAGDLAAEMLSGRETGLHAGQTVGPYTIVSLLGQGGMGEVYLAKDVRLGRQVALKRLPSQSTLNTDRVRRFEQEARAISALNHPNIVTIHEIGQSNSQHFITTEFIEGQTLRQYITSTRMKLDEVLDIATQIASALAAAHAAGLVHRDIKPENIMIRPDGYVKVLDFGLAKLVEKKKSFLGLEESAARQTAEGLILGTVNYMSPEQAKGEAIDERTDIFSLGAVIHEMIAGQTPFAGDSMSESFANLINAKPKLLSEFVTNAPDELQRTILKTLRKKRDERYQTMNELLADLKDQRKNLTLGEILQRAKAEPGSARTVLPATADGVSLQTAITQHSFSQRLNRQKHLRAVALGLTGLIVVAGLGFALSERMRRNRPANVPVVPFQAIELIRVTNTGRVSDAAISPDGKFVAYVSENGGKKSVWVREIATSNNVEIIPPAEVQYYGGTFSLDGSYLYYIAKELNNSIGALHRVPVQGGVPVKLIVDVDGPISVSPDGKQLAFVRGASTGERALMIANADGSEERKLAARTGYDAFSFGGPAWSPDGKSIATGAAYTDANGRYLRVVSVEVADGSVKPITSQKWKGVGRVWWMNDGKGLVFNASDLARSSTSQLWYLSYPGGEAHRITRDLQDYDGVTLTSDSNILVSKQTQTFSSLWIGPTDDADQAKPILSHNEDQGMNAFYYYRTRFSWLPNGQIIYTSLLNGTPSIWTMTAQGTANTQLTDDSGGNNFPSMTSDGRYIVFVSDRTGFTNVWRMDSDGKNQTQLTTGEDDSWVWCSPKGTSVVYHSGQQGKRTLWRVSVEGGKPEKLTDYPSVCPVVSPDGKWISSYYRPGTKDPWRLAIIPFDGGPPVKTFEVPQNVFFQSLVRWTPDGLSLAYIRNRDGVSNIWLQPVDGGPARQLSNFKSDQIFWFDWSPDGGQLGVSRGAVTSDVVLIRDLQRPTE
ncbi:MAG TPA: protein kinase [Pyrinomonadaceae bacterium]|nr:protein kinase [Pyrinomonadaceae bacterium]